MPLVDLLGQSLPQTKMPIAMTTQNNEINLATPTTLTFELIPSHEPTTEPSATPELTNDSLEKCVLEAEMTYSFEREHDNIAYYGYHTT